MKKVFAVNSGCYSDYGIDAIFSTRKLAKEFMAAVPNSDYNDIAEYEIDPPDASMIRRGYGIWNVLMLRNGDTERVDKREISPYSVGCIGCHVWERTKVPAYKGTDIKDVLDSTVWAKTAVAAVKITNEKRVRMIAEGSWK